MISNACISFIYRSVYIQIFSHTKKLPHQLKYKKNTPEKRYRTCRIYKYNTQRHTQRERSAAAAKSSKQETREHEKRTVFNGLRKINDGLSRKQNTRVKVPSPISPYLRLLPITSKDDGAKVSTDDLTR